MFSFTLSSPLSTWKFTFLNMEFEILVLECGFLISTYEYAFYFYLKVLIRHWGFMCYEKTALTMQCVRICSADLSHKEVFQTRISFLSCLLFLQVYTTLTRLLRVDFAIDTCTLDLAQDEDFVLFFGILKYSQVIR